MKNDNNNSDKPLTMSQRFQDFSDFSSGSEKIDKYLKSTHKRNKENPRNLPIFFIKFDEFDEIKLLKKGGESIIFTSIWKNGINGSGPEDVVLRTLFDEQKIINELDLQSKLYGTYIPQVYGVTKDLDNNFMIVMEYAEHGDLRDYLSNNFNKLKFEDKLRMLKEIILAIKDIHSAGYIHGDLHPGNILRGKNSFYVSDLGLCRRYSKELENKENKEIIYGIPPYVAPEVFLDKTYGPEADIYGFGIVAWEILSGKQAYDDYPHDFDLVQLIISGKRPPPINGTPKDLWKLIQSCWNKDYTKRPKARQIYSKLVNWLLFEKIHEKWDNLKKKNNTEMFITDEYYDEEDRLNINEQYIPIPSYSFRSFSINDSSIASTSNNSIISNNTTIHENDDYVSKQIQFTIPENLDNLNS